MRYRYTGSDVAVFPSIVTDAGALVLNPGDVVTLDADPAHALLVAETGKAAASDIAARYAIGDEPEPTPTTTEPAPEA